MASLVLSGDTSGSITVSAPAVSGSNTQTLAAVTGTLAPIVSGTSVTASGTSVDFTSIPSWVKRITVMFNGMSTNGTSNIQIQLGDSGGVETTGYLGAAVTLPSTFAVFSSGFVLTGSNAAARVHQGQAIISNMGSNAWVESSILGRSDAADAIYGGGSKTLSDTLTQVRITTVNGTDTFDAGTINILYE